MKQYVRVVADTNDADYIEALTELNANDLATLRKVANLIKTKKDHNWPTSDYGNETFESIYGSQISEEEIEIMGNYVPYGEYGVHTIASITIFNVESEEELL